MKKIVLITNILSPYRIYLFDKLYELLLKKSVKLFVLVTGKTESDRTWKYENFKREYTTNLNLFTINFNSFHFHFTKRLIKIVRTIKPDILIYSGSYLQITSLQILNYIRVNRIKSFFWSESHLLEEKNYSKLSIAFREKIRYFFYSKFHHFISPGILSDQFIKKYNPNSIILRLPNLIDEDNFSLTLFNEKFNKNQVSTFNSNNKIKLFIVARLTKVKGLTEFLSILGNYVLKNRFSIFIAGSGELQDTLIELANSFNIDMKLLGSLTPEGIKKHYLDSDFFVLPSLSDPSPLSVIEALTFGLPLILSNRVGNHFEALEENVNGFLFNPFDHSQIIGILDKIIEKYVDEKWIKDAFYNSQDIYNKNFSSKICLFHFASKIMELIE
jgi:glycosyltransferase involved in cell wall biosynthesis